MPTDHTRAQPETPPPDSACARVPPTGAAGRTRPPAAAWISWIAPALTTTGSVASLRPSPTIAAYGLAAVFLYVVPAIVFLLPTSLVSRKSVNPAAALESPLDKPSEAHMRG
ncbi:hypothetical protein [Amycolatopsis sp.]|uniref:hypothetical protein n=1 Tax=Amycolatopsis sp. TaxID=37632 RepID=UPI002B5D5277|nr:hypothetical protein [Amycolatopsis sp.]HVV09525.1 hypothetical protein [Amycolatopsis sp.]